MCTIWLSCKGKHPQMLKGLSESSLVSFKAICFLTETALPIKLSRDVVRCISLVKAQQCAITELVWRSQSTTSKESAPLGTLFSESIYSNCFSTNTSANLWNLCLGARISWLKPQYIIPSACVFIWFSSKLATKLVDRPVSSFSESDQSPLIFSS